jgi:hypothetical protein
MLIFILLYQNINYSEIRKLERNLNANLQVDKGGRGQGAGSRLALSGVVKPAA